MEFLTKEEMTSFITGLFDAEGSSNIVKPGLTIPVMEVPDGENVEFVTRKEVETFISGLF